MAVFCNRSEIVYFDRFGVEHVPEEIKEFVGNKDITANTFRVQANNSVTCGYFCIGFIDFMLAGKKLTDFTSMFSPFDFKENDNIILSSKMNKINKINLSENTKFRLIGIIGTENYFHQGINQMKSCSKKLSNYHF